MPTTRGASRTVRDRRPADDAHPVAGSVDLAELVPAATLPVFPNDGHGLTVEHLHDTLAATAAYLR
jgi:hypothetical protein